VHGKGAENTFSDMRKRKKEKKSTAAKKEKGGRKRTQTEKSTLLENQGEKMSNPVRIFVGRGKTVNRLPVMGKKGSAVQERSIRTVLRARRISSRGNAPRESSRTTMGGEKKKTLSHHQVVRGGVGQEIAYGGGCRERGQRLPRYRISSRRMERTVSAPRRMK